MASPKRADSPKRAPSEESDVSDSVRDAELSMLMTRGGQAENVPRGVDLPPDAYAKMSSYTTKQGMPTRPSYNKSGVEVIVGINAFRVTKLPTMKVYQWDVTLGSGKEKRGLNKALWESNAVQNALGPHWLFDGNRLAWSIRGINALGRVNPEHSKHTIQVDLDAERGESKQSLQNARVPTVAQKGPKQRPRRDDNNFTVQIRYAKAINLQALESYILGQMEFDDSVLESINFLNHLMRHNPSNHLITIKNSFFPKQWDNPYELSNGLYAIKGVFQSIRAAQGGKMVVNVDVSHACFLKNVRMDFVACELADSSRPAEIIQYVQKNQKDPPYGPYRESPMMDRLRRLRKVSFTVQYRGVSERVVGRRFIVKDILYTNAKNTFFEMTDRETEEKRKICVDDYFFEQYGFRLETPLMPLIETTKRGVFYPMEVCYIDIGQRWPFKLNERQTADMIKFAVSRPDDRMKSIRQGLGALNWQNDPALKFYGLEMAPQMMDTKARLLSAPKVRFANNQFESPGTAGRWRIDRKKFFAPNRRPLTNWGVVVVAPRSGRCVGQQETMNFVRELVRLYNEYGGNIATPTPHLIKASELNPLNVVDEITNKIKASSRGQLPDLVMYILPRKETFLYNQLKRHSELKYGFVSQMVQSAHVIRNQPQYIGNVLMKINAKLGGKSFKAMPIAGPVHQRQGTYFTKPTMVIGADVSHPSPGQIKPSFAAMTVSMDRDAIRYGAVVQSNGHRLELITGWNISDMLCPLIREWCSTIGGGALPLHVLYFRDGVSEGEYQHILQQEIRDLRNAFKTCDQSPGKQSSAKINFTVIVASKRHHIRFFPKNGPASDRNKNPVPGVIVERDVTTPGGYDFFLCAHSAIQGTARPVHYTVIKDDEKMEPTYLQNLIYEHSYQYIRSSTPVSVFPAIYYAHLASRRAAAHERTQEGPLKQHRSSEQRERDMLMRAKGEAEQTGKLLTAKAYEKLKYYMNEDYPPLEPTANDRIWMEMWFI